MAPHATNRQAAPRTINVRKFAESRAPEIESLHSIVSHRLGNNFRSQRNKRRRTTAHDNQQSSKRSRKRRRDSQLIGDEPKTTSDKLSRRIRRRNELKQNPQSGFSTSGDGTKRLRTHAWHAKRFKMTKLWGFHLPLGLHGRGRGSRALLKWYRQGVVVHDASYHVPVQLEGPEDSLISVLKTVLIPTPSDDSSMWHSVLSGATYGTAMLHQVGEFGVRPISPVTYIWRALDKQNTGSFAQEDLADVPNGQPDLQGSKLFRQIWVWIHASAFTDGHKALEYACKKEMSAMGSSISCFSLEGQLAKLEVMGSNAFQLLQRILHPFPCIPEGSFQLKKHAEANVDDQQMNISQYEEQLPTHAIRSLMVKDPRTHDEDVAIEGENHITSTVISDERLLSSSQCKVLWDACSGIEPPVEENLLCKERHDKRMDSFCLGDRDSNTSDTQDTLPYSRSCPVMLLKNYIPEDQFVGWSLILPLSWVKPFWIPLVSKGAHAIGLREKHWITCEANLPYFPMDFPDCGAYTSFMEVEAAASDLRGARQPPSVRPLKIPVPPPWNTINVAFDGVKGDCQILPGRDLDNSFSIARTSHELRSFIEKLGGPVLLSPHTEEDNKSSSLNALMKEANLDQYRNVMVQVKSGGKLCLLRVMLRAFKEGVFEEGAVVCAPHFADISLWTLSNNGGLQIPESAVASYFKEETSGKWSLQPLPEDPVVRESHRYPIGFVTTGFVRGSKKAVAIGFCEATWLARLREEQWRETALKRRKKEIFVLVRNLRSSAYRLALATIVLEQKGQGSNFI